MDEETYDVDRVPTTPGRVLRSDGNDLPEGEYLLKWVQGSWWLAWRAQSWHAWGAPRTFEEQR